ncbi:MAG: hypothetical protein AAF430_02785 [Myxococcota bacterium]
MTDGLRDSGWLETLSGRLGASPQSRLGLDLARPEDRSRWWCWCRLASERDAEAKREAALRRLETDWGCSPAALVAAGPSALAACLAEVGLRRPEPVAGSLCRAAHALVVDYEGDFERLAGAADGLEELGGGLARLAPGFGATTVLRFLRPLRGVWPAAAETPLAPAAWAAAQHLGWISEGAEPADGPAAFLAACAERAPDLSPDEVEFWFEALGQRACLRGRVDRCGLGAACPARDSDGAAPHDGLEGDGFAG